ncbi:telomerase reverse transcriptase isoform X2 [Triplophysa dalaica]|uniref:telomerase reverse transcriptase isoform X2 n=1 Tax=Triplophysa dalaica TaxID=1582913 RepID=UPI0024DF9876|nr:telomerase reverse transcriptase isoform X2 [Triplophysa dalaica]
MNRRRDFMAQCDATASGLKHALDILRSLYPLVQTLEELIKGIVFSDGRKPVLTDDSDGARFQTLARGLMICAITPLQPVRAPVQLGTLPEVLAFSLNHIKRKKLRNVLGFGYQCSDVPACSDPFRFHGDISQSAAYISTSQLWKRINQRLGSEVTRYLLQDCAVFITVPPSCLLQVCGEPVYDLLRSRPWSGFSLSQNSLHVPIKKPTRKTPVRTGHGRNKRKVVPNKTSKRARDEDVARDHVPVMKRRRLSVESERGDEDSGQPANQPLNACPQSHGAQSWKPGDQTPPRPSHCYIRVPSMLYNGRGMQGFLLNRKLKAGAGGPRRLQGADLVRIVFFGGKLHPSDEKAKPKKLPKRFFNTVPMFARLLQQHRKCPYTLFLQTKCSVNTESEEMESLLRSHCSPYRVYLFVRECLSYVIPDELWGSRQNQLHFLSNVKDFLRLGKFDSVSLVQLMCRMKVNDCHWLGLKKRQCASEHRYREWIFAQFLLWMLNDFVLGLVKALFYVTERMGQKHTLTFYRREIWTKLQQMAFRMHLSKGQWRALSAPESIKSPETTITSRIRFIPKVNSMRPITRLTGPRESLQHFQSCVRVLQNVLSVCVKETPGPMGSTVWGWQDIHRVLKDVTPQQKCSPRPLYFVKVDVSRAYDSLPHVKLVEVLSEVLGPFAQQSFFLRHYARLWLDPNQGLRKRFCTKTEITEPMNMKSFVLDEQAGGTLHNAILVERHTSEVRGADVLQFFKKMLSSYIIHHEKKMFRQVCGIPQGSSVSALLCNLCYGHMENSLLKGFHKGGCLMRLVDDFLLITPHLSKATEFLTTLLAGVPEYGCKINPQKVAVNFPVCEEWERSGVSVFQSHCLFPWCGLLLDTHTLDVFKDYSRYDGLSLRYSLTVGSAHSPATLMKKLLSLLRLKCTDIFIDLRMNSVESVYRSLYKLILLQALRFHACVKSLPLGQNVETKPSFFLKMIWTMARVVNKLIRHANNDGAGVLQYEAVQLLFCLAFDVIFRRHRLVYRSLLPPLHKRRRRLQCALQGIRLARVHQASTPRIPQDFKTIKT